VLGLGQMIDGFEEGLFGKTAGAETVLELKFPENYQAQHLAGKDVQFNVTVKQVAEPVLAELNDEFFAKFGVTEGGEEAFRKEVLENMERERERALQRKFNTAVLDTVAAANELPLPQALVAAEIQRMQQQALQSMMQRGAPPENFDPAAMADMFQEPAKKRVKLGLLMAEMIKTAGITADPAKVRETIETMAASYEDSAAVMKWYYEEPQRLQEIEAMCLEDEAVKWIVGRAEVSEVPISFDDLMNPVQTDD
jgi:trigger factor